MRINITLTAVTLSDTGHGPWDFDSCRLLKFVAE
jgi:hypothetical protein